MGLSKKNKNVISGCHRKERFTGRPIQVEADICEAPCKGRVRPLFEQPPSMANPIEPKRLSVQLESGKYVIAGITPGRMDLAFS
jgi:hypothetical protein